MATSDEIDNNLFSLYAIKKFAITNTFLKRPQQFLNEHIMFALRNLPVCLIDRRLGPSAWRSIRFADSSLICRACCCRSTEYTENRLFPSCSCFCTDCCCAMLCQPLLSHEHHQHRWFQHRQSSRCPAKNSFVPCDCTYCGADVGDEDFCCHCLLSFHLHLIRWRWSVVALQKTFGRQKVADCQWTHQ